jgi:hypothetical protein
MTTAAAKGPVLHSHVLECNKELLVAIGRFSAIDSRTSNRHLSVAIGSSPWLNLATYSEKSNRKLSVSIGMVARKQFGGSLVDIDLPNFGLLTPQ